MNHRQLFTQVALACSAIFSHPTTCAQYRYYNEIKLEVAVRAIERGQIGPQLRSNIEGVAAALSYVYDCSTVRPGFLRNLEEIKVSLVEYSKTDWAKLDMRYGNVTVASALHSYVIEHLRCSLRK